MSQISTEIGLIDNASSKLIDIAIGFEQITEAFAKLANLGTEEIFDSLANQAVDLHNSFVDFESIDMATTFGEQVTEAESLAEALADAALGMDVFSESTEQAREDAEGLGEELEGLGKTKEKTKKKSKGLGNPFSDWGASIIVANQALELTNKIIGSITSRFSNMLDMGQEVFFNQQRLAVTLSNSAATTYELEDNFSRILELSQELEDSTTIGAASFEAGAASLAVHVNEMETMEMLMGSMADYAVMASGGLAVSAQEMAKYGDALGMAISTGNYKRLQRYGIAFDDLQSAAFKYGTELERAAILTEVMDDNWGGLAESLAATPMGQINNLNTQLDNMRETIGMRLMPIWGAFAEMFTSTLGIMEEAVMRFLDFFTANIETLALAFTLLGTVAVMWGIKTKIAWLKPLLVMGLVAAAVYGLAKIFQMFGVTAGDVILFVGTKFLWLFEFIVNLGVDLANYFIGFANFLRIVFVDPLDAIRLLFASVFSVIISMLETTVRLLGRIFGRDWGEDLRGLQSELDTLKGDIVYEHGLTEDIEKIDVSDQIAALEGFTASIDTSLANLSQVERDWYAGVSGMGVGGMDFYGVFPDDVLTSAGGAGGSAIKVQEVNPIDLKDDLRMLMDVSRYRQSFSQISPEISVTFSGDINQAVDVDYVSAKVIDDFAKAIEDAQKSDLGGIAYV